MVFFMRYKYVLPIILILLFLLAGSVNAVQDNDTLSSVLVNETDNIVLDSVDNSMDSVLGKCNDELDVSQQQSMDSDIPLTSSSSDNVIVIGYDDYKHYTVKYKKNTYFTVVVYDKNTYDPVKATFKVKVYTGAKYKTYTIKSVIYEDVGWIKIPTKNLKVGTHKVIITPVNNPYSAPFFTKIIVKDTKKTKKKTSTKKKSIKKTIKMTSKKKKSKSKSVTVRFKGGPDYGSSKKLKTGDRVEVFYTHGGQYSSGVYAQVRSYFHKIHTKITKVKFYFKSFYTDGKSVSKTVKKIKNNKYSSTAKTGILSYYYPYKAKVWYKKA